jgi:hypothetical protein
MISKGLLRRWETPYRMAFIFNLRGPDASSVREAQNIILEVLLIVNLAGDLPQAFGFWPSPIELRFQRAYAETLTK